jgi:hypothetical protein
MEPLTGETLPEPTGEPVVEGTIVAEFSPEDGPSALPPSGPTVGSLLGYTEVVLELPPGNCGLTVNEGRQKTFEVAAGSPLQIPRGLHLVKEHDLVALSPGAASDPRGFQLVSVDGHLVGEDSGAGANLVARARKEPAKPGLLADTTRSHTLVFSDAPVYVGPGGFTTPVGAAELVVDAFAVDRTLFAAANAAKAKSHFCQGRPGTLQGSEGGDIINAPESMCCVFPWTIHMLMFSPCLLLDILNNTLCNKHEDMEFPPWGDAALVLTDKGIIGRRHFGPDLSGEQGGAKCCFCIECNDSTAEPAYWNLRRQALKNGVNAIAWDGFDVDKIKIRTYDAPSRCVTRGDPRMAWDPLVVGPHCGCCIPVYGDCCRCICIQPDVDRLYRATIVSEHITNKGEEDSESYTTGIIELLALARSPDDLRNTLRARVRRPSARGGEPWKSTAPPAAAAMER